jgi:hypothetical protein
MNAVEEQTAATLAAVARFRKHSTGHDVDRVMPGMSAHCRFESTGPAPECETFSGAAAIREALGAILSRGGGMRFGSEAGAAKGVFYVRECDVLGRQTSVLPSPGRERLAAEFRLFSGF